MEFISFSWADYTLFALMFGISTVIGLYFGCCAKQDTAADYLQGGKQMKVFPVSMSLVASLLSGVSLLGIPAEIYLFGTQFWMLSLSILLMGVVTYFVYLPIFYKLQLVSVYEYLEVRFDKKTRSVASALFALSNFILLPVIVYAPSLAFNHVTGINIHIIAPVMSLICIFYTTIGGLKAVVWTDTLQLSVTLCTLFFVLILGTISVGGLTNIWEKARLGERIEFFNMDPDPTVRSTFWNVVFGNFFIWMFYAGIHPATVQRFLAVPTLDDSKRVLVIFIFFTIVTKWISCFSGLIMYAKYFDCDPLAAGYISKADQILPYYVLDVAAQIPGLSGLFVAGLFSTALSTLSTFLNSLSGTVYEDFISPYMSSATSEKKASTIMKILTAVLGIISVGLVFVVERLGTLVQMTTTLTGTTAGPVLGVFMLGMLFPTANEKGALFGMIGTILFMVMIAVKNQIYIWNGAIRAVPKPLFTHGCNLTSITSSILNETSTLITTLQSDCTPAEPHWLFRISFYYYVLMGAVLTIIIGLLVSWATRNRDDPPINPDLICPLLHRFLAKSAETTRYQSVEKALHEIHVNDIRQKQNEIKNS